MRIGGGAQQEQQGRSGGPRSEGGTENSTSGDGASQQIGLEKFATRNPRRPSGPSGSSASFLFCPGRGLFGRASSNFQMSSFEGFSITGGVRSNNCRAMAPTVARALASSTVSGGVVLRETLDVSQRGIQVGMQQQRLPFERRCKQAHGGFTHLQAVVRELHVAARFQEATGRRHERAWKA